LTAAGQDLKELALQKTVPASVSDVHLMQHMMEMTQPEVLLTGYSLEL